MSNYHDFDLIGDEASVDSGEGEPWMISYLDIMTLLFSFFVMLLSMSDIRTELEPIITIDQSPGSPMWTVPMAVPMGTEAVIVDVVGITQIDLGIASVIFPGAPDNNAVVIEDPYASQFGELQNSLNALDLQGVNATPGREGLTLRIADNLLFDSAQAELMTEGMLLIRQLIQLLADFKGQISIEGHTDNIPISTERFPSNWELSSARAISVLKFLELDGIVANRMRAIGYAETQPLQNNDIAQGRAANRRVELILRAP